MSLFDISYEEFSLLEGLEQYHLTLKQREFFEEKNLENAFQYVNNYLENAELIDHLEKIHFLLSDKCFYPDQVGHFRSVDVCVVVGNRTIENKQPYGTFPEMLEIIKKYKSKIQDPLKRLAFEHYCLLDIHPFEDGNGRLSRFILAVGLQRLGAKYCYQFLKRDDAYLGTIIKAFQEKNYLVIHRYLEQVSHF